MQFCRFLCFSNCNQSDFDENLVPIEVEEDESLQSHELDMTNLNDEGDGNHEVEYEFNLQDYLV